MFRYYFPPEKYTKDLESIFVCKITLSSQQYYPYLNREKSGLCLWNKILNKKKPYKIYYNEFFFISNFMIQTEYPTVTMYFYEYSPDGGVTFLL